MGSDFLFWTILSMSTARGFLRGESLAKSDNLPDPDILAQDLEAALEQFREVVVDLDADLFTDKDQ